MFIRVLEIHPGTGSFHFRGAEAQTWFEVDWFRDDNTPLEMYSVPRAQEELTSFIKKKNYYDPRKSYLVLYPKITFTINYEAP